MRDDCSAGLWKAIRSEWENFSSRSCLIVSNGRRVKNFGKIHDIKILLQRTLSPLFSLATCLRICGEERYGSK